MNAQTQPAPLRRAYPVEEARALLGGMSRKSLYDLINSGDLATVKIAGRRLVPSESIDALIDANLTTKPGAERAA